MTEEIKDTPEVLLEKLRKANQEAKEYREQLETVQSQLDQANVWKTTALQEKVKNALREQGVKNPDRILKLVNVETVEVEDGGKLKGLDEQVTAIKGEWPELFDKKKDVAGGADIFTKGDAPKPLTGTEAQVAKLFAS